MSRRVSKYLLAAVTALCMLTGCDNDPKASYAIFEEIGADGWDPRYVLLFEPVPRDSVTSRAGKYDVTLVLRYAARHSTSTLPIAVSVEDHEGILRADTISIAPQARQDSSDSSRLKYGVLERRVRLYDDISLNEDCTVSLETLIPPKSTEGLLNVGLLLTPK